MAWDSTQPTNTTKIRNLGVVIRPNWAAIETGDATFKPYAINFANRTTLPVPNDPVAVANTYILYSKQDPAGSVQLYGINQASTVVQISNAWGPVSAANGYSWLAGGMLIQWGTVSVPAGSSGNINFPVAFSAVPYSIVLTPIRSAGASTMNIYVLNASVTASRFRTENTGSGAHDIYYMAIGPKV